MIGKGVISLIATIAIVTTVASLYLPLYADSKIRKVIITQISKLSDIKTEVTDEMLEFTEVKTTKKSKLSIKPPSNLPKGVYVSDTGVITMYTNEVVDDSKIRLIPFVGDGYVTWSCRYDGLKPGQAPIGCEKN